MRRMISPRALAALIAAVAASGTLVACGDGGDDYVPPPPPEPSAPASANDGDDEESIESRVAAMMETNDRASFGVDTRDPFTQPRPTRGDGPIGPRTPLDRNECDLSVHPLGKTELEQMEIMGLVTGTALPRAMILAPGSEQAIIVTEGALAGPDCTNRLVDIRDNQIVFEQITMGDEERVETILELNDRRLPTRFIEIENE